jgi:NADPH-dependent 2,4-dienoyl-CoA reductase/sulfur reductase-like enzyme
MAGGRIVSAAPPHIAIAGSGLAGLQCATLLAHQARVTVFERLPVAGGEHWQDANHRVLIRRADAAGVKFCPGTQVIRWEGDRLLAIGEHGGLANIDALVVATGHRPSTRAELNIDGDRNSPVLPVTVALHLLAQNVALGDHIVIDGDSAWTAACINALIRSTRPPSRITVMTGESGASTSINADTRIDVIVKSRITATHGRPRIIGITIDESGARRQIACDCLILSGAAQPYRNIDGAVLDDATVAYAQRNSGDQEPLAAISQRAVHQAIQLASDKPNRREPVAPRVGPPKS